MILSSALLLILGLALVVKGADWLIDGASSLAKRFSIPEIVIGLTVVAFGTSAPELVVNIFSSLERRNELVLGNIIGSNIFNTLLILGIAGLIYPLWVKKNTVWKEIPFSIAVIVVLMVLANDRLFFSSSTNQISRFDGVILLLLFVLFLIYALIISRFKTDEILDVKVFSIPWTIGLVFIGVIGLFVGGKLVVNEAVIIARSLRVSEKLIGLTILSGGTSLPELVTSARAALRKRSDMAVGNVVGSNIFNVLLVMGTSSAIHSVEFQPILNLDMFVFIGASVFLFITMFIGVPRKLERWQALFLLAGYIVYMYYIIVRR